MLTPNLHVRLLLAFYGLLWLVELGGGRVVDALAWQAKDWQGYLVVFFILNGLLTAFVMTFALEAVERGWRALVRRRGLAVVGKVLDVTHLGRVNGVAYVELTLEIKGGAAAATGGAADYRTTARKPPSAAPQRRGIVQVPPARVPEVGARMKVLLDPWNRDRVLVVRTLDDHPS